MTCMRDALLALGADQLSLWERFLAGLRSEPERPEDHIGDSLIDPASVVNDHCWILRRASTDEGTVGEVICVRLRGNVPIAEPIRLASIEPPWRDNRMNESCIPWGSYRCELKAATGKVIGGENRWYQVLDVLGRSEILIHPGNWAGDKTRGMYSDSEGCILFGAKETRSIPPGQRYDQLAVLDSRKACDRLYEYFDGCPFWLHVGGVRTG